MDVSPAASAMVVILDEALYGEWLSAPVAESREFFKQYPSDLLVSEAPPKQ